MEGGQLPPFDLGKTDSTPAQTNTAAPQAAEPAVQPQTPDAPEAPQE